MNSIWQPFKGKIAPKETEVHLIIVDLSKNQALARYEAYLSFEERQRANRFLTNELRSNYIMARGILREILGNCLEIHPDKIQFRYQDLGKPELVNNPKLHFNVSHSGNLALYGLRLEHAIGVDIEKIRACNELELAERFFSLSEYQSLLGLEAQKISQAFFEIWAKKEAYIKALGQGIAYLSEFSVTDYAELKGWHLEGFDYQNEFKAAFATQVPVRQVYYWKFAK